MANTQVMLDYVKQLKRHTEGRTAVILRLTALERPFVESHYRQTMAACLTALCKQYEGAYFALPNKDGLAIVKDAHIDNIDTVVNNVREALKDSAVIKSLDPIQGVSDLFSTWYFLESDYDRLYSDIQKCVNGEPAPEGALDNTDTTPDITNAEAHPKAEINTQYDSSNPAMLKMPKGQRMVPVTAPKPDLVEKQLDPETLYQLYQALKSADVEGMMQKQMIMAVIPGENPLPLMLQRFVSFDHIVSILLPTLECNADHYLSSYVANLIDTRVLQSTPSLESKRAMLSSIRLSLDSILQPEFQMFDQSISDKQKHNIVIELSLSEGMQVPATMEYAVTFLTAKGYKTCLGGIDPQAFQWLHLANIKMDFMKLNIQDPDADYLSDKSFIAVMRDRISTLEAAKIILGGCDNDQAVSFGQACGISLFQGAAVSPIEY